MATAKNHPRLAITPGEPAGVGPELCLRVAAMAYPAQLVAVSDRDWLEEVCRSLSLPVELTDFDPAQPFSLHRPGRLPVLHTALNHPVTPGRPDPENAAHVLDTLRVATRHCLAGTFDALVTGPVDKGVISQSGVPFTGHTGFLAALTQTPRVVMMLATDRLRVVLATEHLPLAKVPETITTSYLRSVIQITHGEMIRLFGIANPRLLVCALNPHAGEGGYLGTEEREVIGPVIHQLRSSGLLLEGPLPADTLFTPEVLQRGDAVICMYHDQGLPVLKYQGFGKAVNITLGLPIIRTSVDHGTAYALAGKGQANSGSLQQAVLTAIEISNTIQAP